MCSDCNVSIATSKCSAAHDNSNRARLQMTNTTGNDDITHKVCVTSFQKTDLR